jgi:hypothetical protein
LRHGWLPRQAIAKRRRRRTIRLRPQRGRACPHRRCVGRGRPQATSQTRSRPAAQPRRSLQENVSVWAIYERELTPFRRKDGMDVPTQLTLSGTAEVCHALITPPKSTLGPNPAIAGLHTRPRLGLLGSLRPEPPSLVRGGLPPQVLRRSAATRPAAQG